MNAPRPPTYDQAFFSSEVQDPTLAGCFEVYFEAEAACFHEAGHAVVGYMLELGLSRVELRIVRGETKDGKPGVGFGGQSVTARRFNAAATRDINRLGYCRAALAHKATIIMASTCNHPEMWDSLGLRGEFGRQHEQGSH